MRNINIIHLKNFLKIYGYNVIDYNVFENEFIASKRIVIYLSKRNKLGKFQYETELWINLNDRNSDIETEDKKLKKFIKIYLKSFLNK